MTTLSFRVTGLVQHVWFRGWAQMTARSLGLVGWVRNRADGSVEGQVQVPPGAQSGAQAGAAALETFCEALRQGPPSARVAEVVVEYLDLPERFDDFHVRR